MDFVEYGICEMLIEIYKSYWNSYELDYHVTHSLKYSLGTNSATGLTVVELEFALRKDQRLSSSTQHQYRRWDPLSPPSSG
jgi:hypothetical protein